MKIFNTVDELWSFCTFCPLCQDDNRTISLQVGPDDEFSIMPSDSIPYEKENSQLKLYPSYQMDRDDINRVAGRIAITYLVNCQTNTFTIQFPDTTKSIPTLVEAAKHAKFYFYIYAKCFQCANSYADSSDIEFDLENSKVHNIQMEQEGYYLQNKYHVTVSHEYNILMVSRLEAAGDALIDHEKVIELPYINLDFSNVTKMVSKIGTLILFS